MRSKAMNNRHAVGLSGLALVLGHTAYWIFNYATWPSAGPEMNLHGVIFMTANVIGGLLIGWAWKWKGLFSLVVVAPWIVLVRILKQNFLPTFGGEAEGLVLIAGVIGTFIWSTGAILIAAALKSLGSAAHEHKTT